MDHEIRFNRRMERLHKLQIKTAKDYVSIYDRDDKRNELYSLKNNEIDHGYIDEFLADIKDEIARILNKIGA